MNLSPERVHLSVQTGAPVLSNGCTCFSKYMHLFFIHFLVTVTVVTVVFIKVFHAYVCTYAGDFSLFFTVPSVTVPYLFLVTDDGYDSKNKKDLPAYVRMYVRRKVFYKLSVISVIRHLRRLKIKDV